MTKDEALKLALEALESGADAQVGRVVWTEYDSCLIAEAITAIKEALAQPVQEPVMQEKIHALKPMLEALRIKQVVSFSESQNLLVEVANKSGMLPPAFEISGNQWCALVNLAVARFGNNALLAQPAQELQVRTGDCLLVGVCASEGHKIQAKRPWVGLTKDQFLEAARLAENGNYLVAFNRIQQWLKEGNT